MQLKTTTIGNENGPHLLILGGVHGDEFEAMAAIRRMIPILRESQLCGRVTLVPVVNEPAFLLGRRTAEDELDLARTCPGRADGSTTERIAHAVSVLIRSADYLIDLHSGGNAMWALPLAGYALHADAGVLQTQKAMACAFNLPIVWGTSGNLPGRTLSVARDANVPAIYAEWMGAGVCDERGVQACFDGCLNVMTMLGIISRPQSAPGVLHEIEDPRENSGHLQLNYPSPATGFFETSVKLGDEVCPGDLIGSVCDALGESRVEIVSTQTGIVLCLRAFSRVLEGDCLAVILEAHQDRKQDGNAT